MGPKEAKNQGRLPYRYEGPGQLRRLSNRLSDRSLSLETHRAEIDRLCYLFSLEYLMAYMGTPQGPRQRMSQTKDMDHIRTEIARVSGSEGNVAGLMPLLDLRGTAAVVREIIFGENTMKAADGEDAAWSFDLGSGSGVLTLASAIALRRAVPQGRRLSIGFEVSSAALAISRSILTQVLERGEFHLLEGDLLRIRTFQDLRPLGAPKLWTSETFSGVTPPFTLTDSGVELDKTYPEAISSYQSTGIEYDPLPHVISLTLATWRDFAVRVKRGETAMFPDVVNGRFSFEGAWPRISLTTSTDTAPRELQRVGDDFSGFRRFLPVDRFPGKPTPSMLWDYKRWVAEALQATS